MADEPPPRDSKEFREAVAASIVESRRARREQRQREIERAIAWLEVKWKDAHCPYCGADAFEVSAPVPLARTDGGIGPPLIPVMCQNCGQTVFVNAYEAGVLERPPPGFHAGSVELPDEESEPDS